jgi:hypothetical protein
MRVRPPIAPRERPMSTRYWITDPWVFFGASAAPVAYLLDTMIRKRKGERPGSEGREPDL